MVMNKMLGLFKKDKSDSYVESVLNIPSSSEKWLPVLQVAVGGLTEVGFSHKQNHLLLVVSSSGRSVYNCMNGERLARDYSDHADWYSPLSLICKGIGPLSHEDISISGLCGGGLPMYNRYGESLVRVAPQWPLELLIWCPKNKDALTVGHQDGCIRLASDHFICTGFSWDGEFIVSATSSDFNVWCRK